MACLFFLGSPLSVQTAQAVGAGNHDEDHPVTMQQAARTVANAAFSPQSSGPATGVHPNSVSAPGQLNREVFGFALSSSLADRAIGYPSWNFDLLSTAAFFGLTVYDTGQFNSDSAMSVWRSSDAINFVNTAHSHGTKVVLTIILQDFSPGTPHMCNGLSNRAATVTETVNMVRLRGVDGVNVDYEGLNGTCQNGQTARAMMTDLVHQLRGALPAAYISVDTYGSSAGDPSGFFDVPGMAAWADSFFVMSYDMEYSNWRHQPPGCTSFCLGPTAPLSAYYYNDTDEMSQYSAVVPSSKVILGVPYYGRKSCVNTAAPNQAPQADVIADTYQDALYDVFQQPGAASVIQHRDTNDPAGQEPWATWTNSSICTGGTHVRELYWDDTASLGLKYDLVNRDHLRGVGIWNLNFGGGQLELWDALAAHFTCTPPASTGHTTNGYNILTGFGGLYSFGSARYWGNLVDHQFPGPAAGLAETPTGCGYSILTSFGGIYSFGNARYFGNLIDHNYPGPGVAVAMSPSGGGYAILTNFGGIYTFGDAQYFGNLIDHGYPGPAVSMSYSPTGRGYVILTASGGIYSFGDARYHGNLIDHHFPGPAASVAYTATGNGYDILTSSGGVYTFGDATYFGNLVDHGYPGPGVALSLTP